VSDHQPESLPVGPARAAIISVAAAAAAVKEPSLALLSARALYYRAASLLTRAFYINCVAAAISFTAVTYPLLAAAGSSLTRSSPAYIKTWLTNVL
jgi:hypothetical protein